MDSIAFDYSFATYLKENDSQLINVSGDGQCLIYAIRITNSKISYLSLIKQIQEESDSEEWINFF